MMSFWVGGRRSRTQLLYKVSNCNWMRTTSHPPTRKRKSLLCARNNLLTPKSKDLLCTYWVSMSGAFNVKSWSQAVSCTEQWGVCKLLLLSRAYINQTSPSPPISKSGDNVSTSKKKPKSILRMPFSRRTKSKKELHHLSSILCICHYYSRVCLSPLPLSTTLVRFCEWWNNNTFWM